jgi:excisionase family DNA binding protein
MNNDMIPFDEPLLTPEELSKWLNIELSTIYKWTSSGYIPTVKLGGKVRGSVRFARRVIRAWIIRNSRRGRGSYKLGTDDVVLS